MFSLGPSLRCRRLLALRAGRGVLGLPLGVMRRASHLALQQCTEHYVASVRISGGQSIKVLQSGRKSAVETWNTYGHLMGGEDTRQKCGRASL